MSGKAFVLQVAAAVVAGMVLNRVLSQQRQSSPYGYGW